MRQWIRSLLNSLGYAVFNTRSEGSYARDGLFTYHSAHFRSDPAFRAAYARGVKASQGVDPRMEWRFHVALWAAGAALRAAGDFVECGVNAGFVSSGIMQYLDWKEVAKQFFLIDTFKGPVLTQYSVEEIREGRRTIAEEAVNRGAYVTDLERVRANYAEWPNCRIVQGAVPDVLPLAGIESVAFLHLDMNCAYPERAALEYFWERLTPGGMVLLDDYAYFGNRIQGEAIDEAVRSLGAKVLALPTGQGLIMK
jgi:hypothetical protein